jgi:hypothetical protein
MCDFRPFPLSTSLISPRLYRLRRGGLISRAVTELDCVVLRSSTSTLAVKKPWLCRSACRTTSIRPCFWPPFTIPSNPISATADREPCLDLVWRIMSLAVADALSNRSTELILRRHLARHALSSASHLLLSCVLRFINAFLFMFCVKVPRSAPTGLLGNPLVRCREIPYKISRVAADIQRKQALCEMWPQNDCCL